MAIQNFERSDQMEFQRYLARWDGYQSLAGRLELFAQAFPTDFGLDLRGEISHEGPARHVAFDTMRALHGAGLEVAYARAFREILDENKPQDLAIRDALDVILAKYA